MKLTNIDGILRETTLGKNLTESELHRLAEVGKWQEVAANTILMSEGDNSDALMVLLAGETEILKSTDARQMRQVTKLNSGAVLGEMGLFLARPRQATVRTLTPCQLLVFQREALHRLVEKGDSLVSKVAINLGQVVSYKLEILNNHVIYLLKDNEALLETIENLKISQSQSDLDKIRTRLFKQAEQLRQNQANVEKQLNYLDREIQHTRLTRRVAELVIALVAGGITTLIIARLLGMGLNKISVFSNTQTPNPTAIPYVSTPEDCEKRDGSVWYEGTCWDLTHRTDW